MLHRSVASLTAEGGQRPAPPIVIAAQPSTGTERTPATMRLPLSSSVRMVATGLGVGLGVVLGVVLAWRGVPLLFPAHTTISESAVIDRLDAVAKLITTEAMVRDVVTYENTWLGSTKRSLVIVTGKTLVGLDLLQTRPRIAIRQSDRRITMVLPHARLLGVDIVELRTYDERRGLWNPFHPADRDTIYQLARRQLASAALDLAVVAHAEESARRFLIGLFATDGYTVEVTFAPAALLTAPLPERPGAAPTR
jgi:hypothetical protein